MCCEAVFYALTFYNTLNLQTCGGIISCHLYIYHYFLTMDNVGVSGSHFKVVEFIVDTYLKYLVSGDDSMKRFGWFVSHYLSETSTNKGCHVFMSPLSLPLILDNWDGYSLPLQSNCVPLLILTL